LKTDIINLVKSGLQRVPELEGFLDDHVADNAVERTKDPTHGDFSSNIAMRYAKVTNKNPRDLASIIIKEIPESNLVKKIEIAGPGFINFHMSDLAFHEEISKIITTKDLYGKSQKKRKEKILLEFVSANPTGPLHVGHGRHAAYGATLGNILDAAGYSVKREYYVNDAGRQMDILCISVIIRMLKINTPNLLMPAAGYQGDYIETIAASLNKKINNNLVAIFLNLQNENINQDKEQYIDILIQSAKDTLGLKKFNVIKKISLELIRTDIEDDLKEFGVTFDTWFSENSLAEEGHIKTTLSLLENKKLLYKKDGAIWFKATEFDDEKDRVVTRENKNNTYFTSDIAYHHNKKVRGFDRLIDILGSDHHGYIARVRAGLVAMGHQEKDLEVELVQFVNLFRAAKKQSMSTRSGEFVTLRQLREEVGNDAARFFYIMRSNEQHLDFDLELAKTKSNENPVYYIQYAHARIASVFRQLEEKKFNYNEQIGKDNISALVTNKEKSIMSFLSRFPEVIELSANNRAPHNLAQYLRDLANEFHSYYNDSIFIVEDENIRNARMLLIKATQLIIKSGLQLLGVSSPKSM
jgi:arginyl-tRNA synthetase|tara:strand:+ start:10914 stop:12659 length:1746 start_codon:yes stop_codon:yes gene_type:complete